MPAPGGPGEDPPPDGYCCGRYASYWNAFLFKLFYFTFLLDNFIDLFIFEGNLLTMIRISETCKDGFWSQGRFSVTSLEAYSYLASAFAISHVDNLNTFL